jgi:hypothetical protein
VCSQSGDNPLERFSQIWLQAKYKKNYFKHPSIFLATLLEPCIENWQSFLSFGSKYGY